MYGSPCLYFLSTFIGFSLLFTHTILFQWLHFIIYYKMYHSSTNIQKYLSFSGPSPSVLPVCSSIEPFKIYYLEITAIYGIGILVVHWRITYTKAILWDCHWGTNSSCLVTSECSYVIAYSSHLWWCSWKQPVHCVMVYLI